MSTGMKMAASAVRFTFVTSNKKKLEEVQGILGKTFPFPVDSQSIELPELQGTPEEISVEKCRIAASKVCGPVLTEDTSLCFDAMNGLPGPYIKHFLEALGHEGLNRMLDGFATRTAYAQCIFALSLGPGHEPITFVGRTPGKIVAARGPKNFGWDPIFEPDAELQLPGQQHTFAEMDAAHKNTISHRYRSLDKLRQYVTDNAEEIVRTLSAKVPKTDSA